MHAPVTVNSPLFKPTDSSCMSFPRVVLPSLPSLVGLHPQLLPSTENDEQKVWWLVLCVHICSFSSSCLTQWRSASSRSSSHMTPLTISTFLVVLMLQTALFPYHSHYCRKCRNAPYLCELKSLLFAPPVLLSLLICRSSRSSVDEEVAPLDDGQSDDDILANSSDEEEDSSSLSSKGEAERPEESRVRADLHHSVLVFHLGLLIFLRLFSDAGETEE